MPDKEFLRGFIDSDIYLINDDEVPEQKQEEKEIIIPERENSFVEEPESNYEPTKLVFSGGNDKGIAVVINDPETESINLEDETLLLKILSAVNLSIKDVAIINIAKQNNTDLNKILSLPCTKGIIFDSSTTLLNSDKYSLMTEEGVFFKASSLREIAKDVNEKKLLWETLKKVFI